MPSWVNKMLEHNPGEKSLKAQLVFYIDLECILKKLQSSQNNPEKSFIEKKARHEPSGWSMFTRCSFDKKEIKLNYYRGNDCIEKLCKKLKQSAMKMIPLTHEENNFYKKQEACHMFKETFCTDKDDKSYVNKRKVKYHCHYTGKFRGADHSKCNLNYKVPKDNNS